MKLKVELEGLGRVLTRLKMLEKAESKPVKNQCLTEAGRIMVDAMKDSAPKDTGALQSSIRVVEQNSKMVAVSYEGAGAEGRDTIIYGFYQHFGSCRNMATNFVTVAYENCRGEIVSRLAEIIREAIGD